MKMASNDATAPSQDGAANLVPESQQEVMALEPVAGAALAAPVAGQFNAIDPWIKQNFVQAPAGEFTVSPRNAPGEVLMDLELGPELNPFLAHLAQMYNAYAGGMEVQIILAGNAFTAGKIIVCAVPPNFPPDRLSASQATNFPHVIMDVRTLEPVILPLPDVRAGFFHYNQLREPRMRLMALLYTPLRANGTGDDAFTVSCRVLTRPMQDFEFMFLVPPTVESRVTPFSVPTYPVVEMTNSRWPARISGMHVNANQTLAVQFQNGRCTLDGQLMGTTQLCAADVCRMRGRYTSTRADLAGVDHTDHNSPPRAESLDTTIPTDGPETRAQARTSASAHLQLEELNGQPYEVYGEQPAPLGTPDFQCRLMGELVRLPSTSPAAQSRFRDAFFDTYGALFAPAVGSTTLTVNNSSSSDFANGQPFEFLPIGVEIGNSARYDEFALPSYNGAIGENRHLAPVAAPGFPGENIIFFSSNLPVWDSTSAQNNRRISCLLPNEFIQHFYDLQAPSQSDVALLRYVHPESGRVLFECKLYRDGFLTVNGASLAEFPVNGYFRFDSWVNQFFTLSPVGTGSGRRGRSRNAQ
uniref:VP1 n=1 Tax=Norovirus GVI TaxID=1274209 RepID=A0A455PD46_NORV|nr:VP1 [Norovirus GVI]